VRVVTATEDGRVLSDQEFGPGATCFNRVPNFIRLNFAERVSAEPKTGGVGRLLETVEQLESLPTGSVVRSRYSEVLVRSEYRDDWYAPGDEMFTSTKFIDLPALLLWEERAKQPT
jgi:hypothetical protein